MDGPQTDGPSILQVETGIRKKETEMKKLLTALLCAFAIFSQFTLMASAQTIGYSATDNDQDATGRLQQFYKININTGETNYLGELAVDRNNDNAYNELLTPGTGERIQREYEGFASIDAVLYGVPEFANLQQVGQLCNTGQDPITGLSVDLRVFRYNGPQQTVPTSANRLPAPIELKDVGGADLANSGSVVGPQIGETCIQFGTESALGYNKIDGYLYSIASDDLIALPAIRSRIYRIDPTTGLAVASADITNPGFVQGQPNGDFNPYLDGLTILPNGAAYGSELRFDVDPNAADADTRDGGGLYRVFLATGTNPGGNQCGNGIAVALGTACLVKYLLPASLARDTGLANQANGTLYLLNERGIIYRTTVSQTSAVTQLATMHTTGATEGAGGGAAGQRIEGCRGAVAATSEFEIGADLSLGGCRDFEGFDIPLLSLSQASGQAAP